MIFLDLLRDLLEALSPVVKDVRKGARVSTESLAALITTVFATLTAAGVPIGLDPLELAAALVAVGGFVVSQRRKRIAKDTS